jgi:hypothetical protein
MPLTTTTVSASGFAAQVRCDYCPATAPRIDLADRPRCQRAAVKAAEAEGFVSYQGGKVWCCPACRIRRLPDHLKALLPSLCARYGVPAPTAQTPTRKPRRRGRKKPG